MFSKKFFVAAGTLAAITLSAVMATPAKADVVKKIDAMYGHNIPNELADLDAEAVVVGRVVRKSGDLAGIKLWWPDSVDIDDKEYSLVSMYVPWDAIPGSDVVLAYVDGGWTYVSDYDDSTCMGCYITRLDLKEVQEVEKVSIDWGESEPVALPAIQPSTAVVAPAPEPIRGLW